MNNENENLYLGNFETTNDIEEQKIISLNKFVLFSIITFGAYDVWWIYKAWKFFQQKEKLDILPAARAIFSIFFLISLFNKILIFSKEKGYCGKYSSVFLFIGIFIGNLLVILPDPFGLISMLSFIFLIQPFNALNYAKLNSKDFLVTEQESMSGNQITITIIGAILWGLFLIGMIFGQ